ncbi:MULTISPECIES: JmjC domain-containing protein [unclassified Streptomyces]|uniref:JmjC domain-containing protein n=1 Tax=unclassified Streptomyces TaxID=2593676 RepID=UPI0022AEF816|nr:MULTISPECIES: cupin domain-containing protein [unclassified Streptomyces]MCZ4097290.1 cupin-like domain-containing protein [Streptomyces sp. H39-C1]MCZ4120594.1 cupin-like domain-containing protein [Streptomyces sp. H39-S7]
MTSALHRLVEDPEEFRRAWPAVPTVYKRDAKELALLANHDSVREIIADPDVRPGGMGMVRDGRLTGETPTADHKASTLVLNGLHRSWPPLMLFCKEIGAQLGHPVTGNVYLTPGGQSQGFAWHWDCHHVFIAQVSGSKRWSINEPVFVDPLEHHNWKRIGFSPEELDRFNNKAPDYDLTLTAGDVLYLPRGWVHSGRSASDEPSLHITMGVQLLTWHWVIKRLAVLAEEDEAMRAALPPDLGGRDMEDLFNVGRETIMQWLAELDVEKAGLNLRSGQRLSVIGMERK